MDTVQGHHMTPIEEEDQYGTPNPPPQEIEENESEPVQESAKDRRGETGAVKEGGEEDRGQDQEEEPVKDETSLSDLKKELMGVREALSKGQSKPSEPPIPNKITEEQWEELEDKTGFSRKQIQTQWDMQRQFAATIDAKISKLERHELLESLSKEKGFEDALKYKADVGELLNDYGPQHQSNPEILKKAVLFARGKNMGSTIRKIQNGKEKNRRISGVARPSSPSYSEPKGGKVELTPIQKSAARSVGMSEEEYASIKTMPKVIER